jgi:hypothetical protein
MSYMEQKSAGDHFNVKGSWDIAKLPTYDLLKNEETTP